MTPTPAADVIPPPPPDQAPATPPHLYAGELWRYIVAHGIARLSREQLRLASSQYGTYVAGPIEPRYAEIMSQHHRIILGELARFDTRDRMLQQLADAADQAAQDQDATHQDTPTQDDAQPPQTPEQQAARLLRAALMLILQPPTTDDRDGGSKVPISPRSPKFPPSNAQAVPQTTTARTQITF